ncbi:MAG: hypothetical protein R2694_01690 [Ilumatobacteraceae bacterium]
MNRSDLLPSAVVPAAGPAAAALVDETAAVLSVPTAGDETSFVLHAPLELMARVGLLPLVAPGRRADAVGMIESLRDRYRATGESVAAPRAVPPDPAVLTAALAAGDLAQVDEQAAALLPSLTAHAAAAAVAPQIVPSLAAAGHAPIGLALLARVPGLPSTLLRPTLRSLARRPDWRLTWFDSEAADVAGPADLYDAVRAAPRLGRPGSDFIYPLMSQIEGNGAPAQLLGPVLAASPEPRAVAATLARTAAWSMEHDDPAQAPYGWSHALTMPQGVMALAGSAVPPRTAAAVAATYLLGFRAAHGTVDLPPALAPGAWPAATTEELATAAALHQDAHLVKYTLACLHAATDDPAFAPLYLRAAQHLVAWWAAADAAR